MKTKAFYLFALIVLTLGCWLSAGFLLSRLGPDWLVVLAIVAWLFASSLALAATRVSHSAWTYAGLLVLAVLSVSPLVLVNILPDPASLSFGIMPLLIPPPTAVLITLLLYSGLTLKAWQSAGTVEGGDSQAERKQAERAAFVVVLSALTLVCWWFAGVMFGVGLFGLLSWLIVIPIVLLFVSAMALAARRVSHGVWILATLLILPGLSLPASVVNNIFTASPEPPFGLLLMPSAALLIAALLLYSGLNSYKEWQHASAVEGGDSQAQRQQAGRAAAVVLVLSALLLAKTLHHLYWFTVWDNTYDSLGYLLLLAPVPAALFSGVTLSITLPGRTKLAGFLYPLLISALMIAVSARAQHVDFRQLTEERAGRASQAIEAYHAREGRYPQDLRQLTPWYILSLPGPVIIYGQDWCYDGGDDYYRLGYVYREHWSDPRLTGRIYKTKGEVPDLPRMCEEEMIALQKRYPDYPYEYWMNGE
jgi:cytochrome bd-type quinol oxidase subunit 2